MLQQGEAIAGLHMGFIDPGQIQLRARRNPQVIRSMLDDERELDSDAQKDLFIQQALDRAFIFQSSGLRDYVYEALRERGAVNSSELSAANMQELLNLSHAIEVGAAANLSSQYQFVIEQDSSLLSLPPSVQGDYFICRDQFTIRLLSSDAPSDNRAPATTSELS